MVTKDETVVPKWLMGAIATVGGFLIVGLTTWMTNIHTTTQTNTVELAKLNARIDGQDQSDIEMKKTMESMSLKMDRLLEFFMDFKIRNSGNNGNNGSNGGAK